MEHETHIYGPDVTVDFKTSFRAFKVAAEDLVRGECDAAVIVGRLEDESGPLVSHVTLHVKPDSKAARDLVNIERFPALRGGSEDEPGEIVSIELVGLKQCDAVLSAGMMVHSVRTEGDYQFSFFFTNFTPTF